MQISMGGLRKVRYASWIMLKFTLLFTLWGCLPTSYVENSNQLRFRTIGRIPVIEGKINGKRAYFIIDTGASCSIINESVSKHFGFKFFVKMDENVLGLGGTAKINQAYNCSVEVGPLKFNHIFRTKHMDDFVDVIRQHENIDIAGIIGSDIFNRYKFTIDFKNQTITF